MANQHTGREMNVYDDQIDLLVFMVLEPIEVKKTIRTDFK
jgi:hypothetical protein